MIVGGGRGGRSASIAVVVPGYSAWLLGASVLDYWVPLCWTAGCYSVRGGGCHSAR